VTGDDELLTWLILYGKERVKRTKENVEIAVILENMGYVDDYWFGAELQITSTGLHRLNQLSKQNKKLGVVK